MDSYLCLCMGGLEEEAAYHVTNLLLSSSFKSLARPFHPTNELSVPVKGYAGIGKVILETDAPVNVVLDLPYFSSILAFVAEGHNLVNSYEEGLESIKSVIRESSMWTKATDVWSRVINPSEKMKQTGKVQFRCSCVRDGVEHHFRSTEIASIMGEALLETLGEDKVAVNLCYFDMEVLGIVLNEHIHVGINLNNSRAFDSGMSSEERAPVLSRGLIATLRPSTANLFIAMSHPQTGDILCDTMLGVGTIPILAATCPTCQLVGLGGDIDETALQLARENLGYLADMSLKKNEEDHHRTAGGGRRGVTGVLHWDARHLPLRDTCIDIAIIDLPFGKRHKIPQKLYTDSFRELARVLRPKGRLFLLTLQTRSVQEVLTQKFGKYFHPSPCGEQEGAPLLARPVNVGGLLGSLFCLERTWEGIEDPPQLGSSPRADNNNNHHQCSSVTTVNE